MNLRVRDVDKIQKKRGNSYIQSDTFLRPEKVVNYIIKDRVGLGSINVKTKCDAIFIDKLLGKSYSQTVYL